MSGVEKVFVFSLVSGGFEGLVKLSVIPKLSGLVGFAKSLAPSIAAAVTPKSNKALWTALIALGLLFAASSTSPAAITTSGSINDGGTSSSDIYIGYSGDGTLGIDAGSTLTRSYGYLGYDSVSTGTATITGVGSTWTNSGSLCVGSSGSGILNIQVGGQVNSVFGVIGRKSGSTGTATIAGDGSSWNNSVRLDVGYSGSGILKVQTGGQVSSVSGYIGYNGGSIGTATVTGVNSTWTNSGSLYVGSSGSGKLTVADGGTVITGTLLASLSDLSGNGRITVSQGAVLDKDLAFDATHGLTQTFAFGTGGILNLTVDSGGTLGAGYKGAGSLRIADGVTVASSAGYMGYQTGSIGTATVTGAGSKWANSGGLYVGYSGNGKLIVTDGGLVTTETLFASLSDLSGNGTITVSKGTVLDADLVFNATHRSTQAISFGSGGTLNLTVAGSGILGAGYNGTGTLRIADGVTITSGFGYLGYDAGSSGTATVTGAGSRWDNRTGLYVGRYGVGVLNIQNGGRIDGNSQFPSNNYIGGLSGSSGTATVTGLGSVWSNISYFYVGSSGCGTLHIEAGGQVSNITGYIGANSGSRGTATVTDVGSKWTNNGELYIGQYGGGTLDIKTGGQVSDTTGYIGYGFGSTGAVTVANVGSKWINSGPLYAGNSGDGTMNIQSDGQVSNTTGHIGYSYGSVGAVTVKSAGSKWINSGPLYVGNSGRGILKIEAGGQVSNTFSQIGYDSSSVGTAIVTGTGSLWTNSSYLYVGSFGSGKLTVADGGKVTATSMSVGNTKSAVRFNVSGNGMLVLGSTSTIGKITNNGTINFYSTAFLSNGTYTPISEYSGRAITWSGTGSYQAVGGFWNNTAHTLTVSAPTALAAGGSCVVMAGQRLVITDSATGRRVGASFYNGTITGSPTFSAVPMIAGDIDALRATAGFEGVLLSAWDFDTTYTGNEVLLAFDVGTGMPNPTIWHYSGGVWSPFTADMFTYDANGIVSFNVTSFDGYAVVSVPEPATMALLAVGGLAILRRLARK